MLLKRATLILVSAGALCACGQQRESPSEAGITLAPEQLKSLNADRSLENRRVSVTGYPMLCSLGANYAAGNVAHVEIHAQQDCSSPRVAQAKIKIGNEKSTRSGLFSLDPRPRNLMIVAEPIDNETTTFVADDYQRISAKTSMRVTGLVTYPFGDKSKIPVLDAVALDAGF